MINNTREKTQKTECVQHKQSPKPGVNFWCTERGAISTSQVPLWFFVIMVKLQLMHLYVFSEVEVSERDWNQGLGYSDLIKHYRIYVAPMTMDMFAIPSCPHSWLITEVMERVTRPVPLVNQELIDLPKLLSSWAEY
jgi:hypothetical protein